MQDGISRITSPFELITPTEKKRMNSASPVPIKARPKYYDTNLLHLPASGLLSILHRVSGAVMFLVLIALLLIILQQTLRPESDFMQWNTMLAQPLAELVLLGFVWAYLHRFLPGRAACGLPFSRRYARSGAQRAPRQPGRSQPVISPPYDHELRRRLPQWTQSLTRHRQDKRNAGHTGGLGAKTADQGARNGERGKV